MSDSLDPIRDLVMGHLVCDSNTRLVAVAVLKLADELTDLRGRAASLEVDRIGHGTRINAVQDRVDCLERADTAVTITKLTDVAELLTNLVDLDHKLILDVQEQLHRHLS